MNTVENSFAIVPSLPHTKCYRFARTFLLQASCFTALFIFIDVSSVAAAYWNIDGSFGRPKLAALIFGLFWSGWVFLSLLLILAYFREHLLVSQNTITKYGCFFHRSIQVTEVNAVIWRGNHVVVCTRSSKMKIDLSPFTRQNREGLTRYFLETFESRIQEGCSCEVEFARNRQAPVDAAICVWLLFIFTAVSLGCWILECGSQFLACGVASGLAGVWYLRRISARRNPTSGSPSQ